LVLGLAGLIQVGGSNMVEAHAVADHVNDVLRLGGNLRGAGAEAEQVTGAEAALGANAWCQDASEDDGGGGNGCDGTQCKAGKCHFVNPYRMRSSNDLTAPERAPDALVYAWCWVRWGDNRRPEAFNNSSDADIHNVRAIDFRQVNLKIMFSKARATRGLAAVFA